MCRSQAFYARTVCPHMTEHGADAEFIGGAGACAGYDALLFYCAVDDTPDNRRGRRLPRATCGEGWLVLSRDSLLAGYPAS